MDHPARGTHGCMDLAGCERLVLDDARVLLRLLTDAVVSAGATVLASFVYPFEPSGLTIVCMLAESHATIHTYPHQGVCMVDVFTCGVTIDPTVALDIVAQRIPHVREHRQVLQRGVAPRRR